MTMSGSIPVSCIERPLGVKYSAVVRRRAERPSSGRMVCTDPLPKVLAPSTSARLWSWRAPATISEALALPPFTSTTMGKSVREPSRLAENFCFCWLRRPSVYTIRPESRNRSETPTAWLRSPPGLFRRSRTSPLIASPSGWFFFNAAFRFTLVRSWNCAMRAYRKPGSRTYARTLLISITSRTMVNFSSLSWPFLRTEMVTLEPRGPRSRLTASDRLISSVDWSSTPTIWSPG